ncbi:MAG: nitroreductase family protein [Betaproteobacteria bacterium]|nr:nitroreductase family protein [Betaproteobacteria bacterium]
MNFPTIPLSGYTALSEGEMIERARRFATEVSRRRTVRDFSPRAVPREVIESAIVAAGSAPSGANRQPWHFAAVANADLKRQIREGAEAEEREFYAHRAPADWLEALAPLGTDANKPFLEIAPWLIAIFSQKHAEGPNGEKLKNYYPIESTGIATGLLIAALHQAGLVTLTHTPSPMKFLNALLGRPDSEKPFLLLVAGYPADAARVPDIHRKPLADIASFLV